MVEAEYTCEGKKTIIQCKENDKVKDICIKFCEKTSKKFWSTLFLLKDEKIYKDMITNKNENQNKPTILADEVQHKKM